MSKQDLLHYWPDEQDVAACVKTEAEASSEAVSSAVHQPMQFERRVIGGQVGGSLDTCNEHELLHAFLAENLPEGRVILPIVGSSGVGKSHVVRWLDAQIRRMPGANRRVIIRIPKGASLRGVIGILLDQLHGPAYETYRVELTRAQQELDIHEAAGLLCEMLANTLEEMGEQAQALLIDHPNDLEAKERVTYCRQEVLPTLLRNQVLRSQHFVRSSDGEAGVIKRLVEQLTVGREAGSEDDRKHIFVPHDLVFNPGIDRTSLGRPEVQAMSIMDREDRRKVATRILNAALDDAKQKLLHLDPTVSDVFDAIRRELLRESRELVLLVEDFAVLSGLQKQLLQVIIKEGVRDGRQVLCTMRTALAYTTGYLDTATVLTRAKVEYRIPDEPGNGRDEEILQRIEQLVGAYLNAARLGPTRLEREYTKAHKKLHDLHAWVPRFEKAIEPEPKATIEAFGFSNDGYELFPFNRGAIGQLAREGCLQNGHLVYNPRFVIQNIIHRVLAYRQVFEHGEFPSATFGSSSTQLPGNVVEEIKRRVPPTALDRYLRFLAYWGGRPTSIDEVGEVESRVFDAFGLDKAPITRGKTGQAKPSQTPVKLTESSPNPQINPLEAKWETLLERWRHGEELPHVDANQVRKWIAEALKHTIDWDWDLFRPRKDGGVEAWHSYVFIPGARGNEAPTVEDAMVAVCTEEDLKHPATSAHFQSALMAVVRFHGVYAGEWSYDVADKDMPRYAAFVESLIPKARLFLHRRYFRSEWDPLPALVHGLLIGARALNLEGADKDTDHCAILTALFLPLAVNPQANGEQVQPQPSNSTGWGEFTANLAGCRQSTGADIGDQVSWITHLLNLIGARQGGADTVHAIDVLQLKPSIEDTLREWKFNAVFPRTDPTGVAEFAPLKRRYKELAKLVSAIPKEQKWLRDWRKRTLEWIGDSDKEQLVEELKETIEAAKASGLSRNGVDTTVLMKSVEEFRIAKVMGALDEMAKLNDSSTTGVVLTVLGRGYRAVASVCDKLHDQFDEFESAIESELRGERMRTGETPLADAVTQVHAELNAVESLLEQMQS